MRGGGAILCLWGVVVWPQKRWISHYLAEERERYRCSRLRSFVTSFPHALERVSSGGLLRGPMAS